MPRSDDPETHPRDQPDGRRLKRRTFIGASGAALLAGCTAESDPSGDDSDAEPADSESSTDDDSSDEHGSSGNFRLLISDLPADIGDFDSLDVSFDRARIFRADGGDEDGSVDDDEDDDTSASEAADRDDTPDDDEDGDDETDGETDGGDGGEEPDSDGDDEGTGNDSNGRGFFELDLEGATVDLTRVVGGKAIEVFDGELEPGQYNKIELYAADVEGIVDGDRAEVKIPSEKLQIVKPFEVTADEPVSFVFDINVVRKGHGGYNLLPVIAKSGVVGEDVEVEEIDPKDENVPGDDSVEEDDVADDADDGEQPDAPGEGEADDSDDDS
ncbi:DUF4382 domain-containing protein [Natrialbaceae archaeon A-CW3]